MFGERLQELREDKGLKQHELAKILNVAANTVSAYENGDIMPKDATKVEIAKFFNVSLDYLFGLTDEPMPLDRNDYIALPINASSKIKPEMLYFLDLLKAKYNLK